MAQTLQPILEFPNPGLVIQNIAWSQDGKYIAGGCENGTILIFDMQERVLLHKFTGHVNRQGKVVFGLTWLPGGILVSSGHDAAIRFWEIGIKKNDVQEIGTVDARTRKKVENKVPGGHSKQVFTLASWKNLVASGSEDKTAKIWDFRDSNRISSLGLVIQMNDRITSVDMVNLDQHLFVGAVARNGEVCIKDLTEPYKENRILHTGDDFEAYSLSFNHLGLMAIGGKIGVFIYQIFSNGKGPDQVALLERNDRKDYAKVVRFSPDGRLLAVKMFSGIVRFYDAKTRELVFEIPGWKDEDFFVSGLAFSPKSDFIANVAGDQSTIFVFPTGIEDIGIQSHSYNDQETIELNAETLGFKPYVRALAMFVTNEKTIPPLTVSIEGEWGTGKSSFMKMLGEEIKILNNANQKGIDKLSWWQKPFFKHPSQQRVYIVNFNPWHYQNADELWAAFALEFITQIGHQIGWLGRSLANLKLGFKSFRWRDGFPEVLRFMVQVGIFFIVLIALILAFKNKGFDRLATLLADMAKQAEWADSLKILLNTSGIFGLVAAVGTLFARFQEYFGMPTLQLKTYIDRPDYQSKLTFFQQFRNDFSKIIESYTGKNARIYVMVDDLDRCVPQVAAELLQATVMVSAQSVPVVTFLAMDRAKVAASLAAKYEAMLPYWVLTGKEKKVSEHEQSVVGIDYGYQFIEKFVQVPFRIPKPTVHDLKNYLDHLAGRTKNQFDNKEQKNRENDVTVDDGLQDSKNPRFSDFELIRDLVDKAKDDAPNLSHIQKQVEDSEAIKVAILSVIDTLERNPRKIKLFTNLLRLRAYILANLGLLRIHPEKIGNGITLPQLAKMVAISIAWPRLVDGLIKDNQLFYRFYSNHEKYGQAVTNYLMELAETQKPIDEFDREFPPPGDLWETDDQSSPWQTWKDNKQVQKLLFKDWHPTTEDVGDISNILLNNSDILLKAIE